MKKLVLFILAVFCCNVAFGEPFEGNPRIVHDKMYSEILGVEREYTVTLPLGYYFEPQKTYPVLYLLHGRTGIETDWITKARVNEVADLLVFRGTAEQMIIVSVNAGGRDSVNEQNGYFNIPGWSYEDFFFKEFVPFIESNYRIIGDKGHRAIAGLSMGGGGSVVYSQHHPEMFCACYAMSALVRLNARHENLTKQGKMVGKMVPLYKSVDENDCVTFVETASPEVLECLRGISWWIDCGDDDFLLDTNIALFVAMKKAGLPCQLRVRDGYHHWIYWHSSIYNCLEVISDVFRSNR